MALDRVQARVASLPAVQRDLRRIGREPPESLLADLLLDEAAMARLAKGAALNTDDLPRLEFAAARSLHLQTVPANRRMIKGYRRRDQAAEVAATLPRPDGARLHEAVGRVLLAKGDWAGAAEQLDRALALDPDLVAARLGRAQARVSQGMLLRAVEDLQAALRVEPTNGAAHSALAQIYQQQQMLADAERHFRRAADGTTPGPTGWAALGRFYLEARQYPEAVEAFREAMRRSPDPTAVMAPLGEALIRAGRSVEAVPLLEQALRRLPDEDGKIHIRLGAAFRLSGQLDASERAYAGAIARNPASLEAHVEMARLHIARGDKAQALAAFERAARIGPLPPAVLRQIEDLGG